MVKNKYLIPSQLDLLNRLAKGSTSPRLICNIGISKCGFPKVTSKDHSDDNV